MKNFSQKFTLIRKVVLPLVLLATCFFSTPLSAIDAVLQVQIDDSGKQVALWLEIQSGLRVLKSSVYSEGVWSPSKTISMPNCLCSTPRLFLTPKGDAVAIWLATDSATGCYALHTAKLSKGKWSSPIVISIPGQMINPKYNCEMSPKGNITLIWSVGKQVYNSFSMLGENWSYPKQIPNIVGENSYSSIDEVE